MFTRGLRGTRGLGEFVNRGWKEENWLTYKPAGAAGASIIPGVSNTTAAAVGGTAAAAIAALAAWWFLKK